MANAIEMQWVNNRLILTQVHSLFVSARRSQGTSRQTLPHPLEHWYSQHFVFCILLEFVKFYWLPVVTNIGKYASTYYGFGAFAPL
jgi:hypothetical protein